jgi:uncharacterized protein (TIGR00255 family)
MVHSMTGYGKASGTVKGGLVQAEIRSLNSKSLELGLRLPSAFKDREPELRRLVSEQVQRGKVDLSLTSENNIAGRSRFNQSAIEDYLRQLKRLAAAHQLGAEPLLPLALSLPDAMTEDRAGVKDSEWKPVLAVVQRALKDFGAFRGREGKVIEKDLAARLKIIRKLAGDIEAREPERTRSMRGKLEKLSEQSPGADANRFEQELIFYLERMDITEEKTRLQSHCDYFDDTLRASASQGKKLGFIAQEMGREINTIGSKANDAAIQRIVVMMKDELEKMKEQLANVL